MQGNKRHRTKRKNILELAVACAFVLHVVALVPAAELKLNATCQPSGHVVRLGEVAQIVSNDAREVELLEEIQLVPTPSPGRTRYLRWSDIADQLRSRGVDMKKHRMTGARQITIKGPRQLAAWKSATKGSPVSDSDLAEIRQAAAQVEKPRSSDVIVALRDIPRGASVRTGDVALQRGRSPISGKKRSQLAFESMEQVIGMEARRAIGKGRVLRPADLRKLLLVRRGDIITVIARAAGIVARTTARARDDGGQGELIAVESLEVRGKYFARVTGLQRVEVSASGPRVEAGR